METRWDDPTSVARDAGGPHEKKQTERGRKPREVGKTEPEFGCAPEFEWNPTKRCVEIKLSE